MSASSLYRSAEGKKAVDDLYSALLARWPVPWQPLELSTCHGRTFAIASGPQDGPPLLLLHGSASNALMWMGDVGELSQSQRVYALDLPGEPGRSAPRRPPWKGPAFAEWLGDVLDQLNYSSAALVGISQGGWTALRFATLFPERVNKLVLLAPGGVAPARLSFLLRALPLLLCGRAGAEAINRIVLNGQPLPDEARAFMDAIMTHFRPRVGAQPLFSAAELERLSMPVLLLVGERDALLPSRKIVDRLRRHVPAIEARVLAGQGHALANLAPAYRPFLEQQP